MAEHHELVLEIPLVEKMSTQDRLKHARKRRAQQLKRWNQYEKQLDKDTRKRTQSSKKAREKSESRSVRKQHILFPSNVMLLEAAARNDLREVKQMLENSVDPDSTNEDGLTALHQCCIDDCEEMMKLLIENGANVNARDSELWTPLHAAATCNHLHLCRYLIDNGAELLAVNADGNMPYDICEDDVTLEYIESEMAARGVTQELIDTTRLSTENNMLMDMRLLVSAGGNLEFRDRNGATPLHIAAANGYIQVAELLLEQRVAVDKQDKDLWQPIHAAACWGHLTILEMLVQNGAEIEAKTKSGGTPYDICEDPDMKQRITEIKMELETNKAVRTLESRYRQRHSTRSSGVSRGSSIYNSNASLSEKSRSSSVRRVSMREKTAISWREAREEAKLRGSANTLKVEDDEDAAEKQEALDKAQKQNADTESSNLGDVTVIVPTITRMQPMMVPEGNLPAYSHTSPSQIAVEIESPHSSKSKMKSTTANKGSPVSHMQHMNKHTDQQNVTAESHLVSERVGGQSVCDHQILVSERHSVHGSRESIHKDSSRLENGTHAGARASLGDKNQDKTASKTSLDSANLPTSFSSSEVPSGTLADLKKQRSQRLRNTDNSVNLELEEQRTSPAASVGQAAPPVSNGKSNSNGSTKSQQQRQRSTQQKTETVRSDQEKQKCCAIL